MYLFLKVLKCAFVCKSLKERRREGKKRETGGLSIQSFEEMIKENPTRGSDRQERDVHTARDTTPSEVQASGKMPRTGASAIAGWLTDLKLSPQWTKVSDKKM